MKLSFCTDSTTLYILTVKQFGLWELPDENRCLRFDSLINEIYKWLFLIFIIITTSSVTYFSGGVLGNKFSEILLPFFKSISSFGPTSIESIMPETIKL